MLGVAALDHEFIRTEEDRSFTPRLLDLILDAPTGSAEWTDSARTLACIEDYRSVGPLARFIEDRARPEEARREIARTLAGFDLTTTSAQRVTWWRSGDGVLAEHGLRLMQRSEGDIVAAVAADRDHPLRAVAISTLEWGFEEPEFQELKVDGLRSDQPDVRVAAAYAAGWDEPLAAEPVLRDLLADNDPEVVKVTAYALQYFPSLTTLESLRSIATGDNSDLERQRAESESFLVGCIESELNRCDDAVRAALRPWCEAIGFEVRDEPIAQGSPQTRPEPEVLDPMAEPEAFEDAVDTTTGSFLAKARALRSIRWSDIAASDRPGMVRRLAQHEDPEVRTVSTVALSRWNVAHVLLHLLQDDHAVVRKCAMYELANVEPDPHIADIAREQLGNVSGIASGETLTTFARHAEPVDRAQFLFDLAVVDPRGIVRESSVRLLAEAGEVQRLRRLMRLLDNPPEVNWSFHLALLNTDAVTVANPERLADLAAVDNVYIAAAATRAIEARR